MAFWKSSARKIFCVDKECYNSGGKEKVKKEYGMYGYLRSIVPL